MDARPERKRDSGQSRFWRAFKHFPLPTTELPTTHYLISGSHTFFRPQIALQRYIAVYLLFAHLSIFAGFAASSAVNIGFKRILKSIHTIIELFFSQFFLFNLLFFFLFFLFLYFFCYYNRINVKKWYSSGDGYCRLFLHDRP